MDNISAISDNGNYCLWYAEVSETVSFFVYCFFGPIYFVNIIIINVVCLIAFYQKSKKEPPYVYQIYVIACETVKMFIKFAYMVSFRWLSGFNGNHGVDWFTSNYYCMWFSAHVATTSTLAIMMLSLLLAIALVIDRTIAVAKPMLHCKTKNAKLHQHTALISCFVISVIIHIPQSMRFKVVALNASYVVEPNYEFRNSAHGNALVQTTNAMRLCGLFILVFSNVSLIYFYRVKQSKTSMISRAGAQERKKVETTITLLAVFQGIFQCISVLNLSTWYLVLSLKPSFPACEGLLHSVLLDFVNGGCDIADFYILVVVNRHFRKMIAGVLFGWTRRRRPNPAFGISAKSYAMDVNFRHCRCDTKKEVENKTMLEEF